MYNGNDLIKEQSLQQCYNHRDLFPVSALGSGQTSPLTVHGYAALLYNLYITEMLSLQVHFSAFQHARISKQWR